MVAAALNLIMSSSGAAMEVQPRQKTSVGAGLELGTARRYTLVSICIEVDFSIPITSII